MPPDNNGVQNQRNGDPGAGSESDPFEGIEKNSLQILIVLMLAGVMAGAAYSLQAKSWNLSIASFATSLAVSGAALLSGGFLGLLFGIPRRLQGDNPGSTTDRAVKEGKPDELEAALYAANTNLEQMSDWLTKILVGAGLTQISNLGDILTGIGEYAGQGFGDIPSADVFAVGILVFFFVDGFLIGFLWTRLYLGRLFTRADRAASTRKRLSQFEHQANSDAEWLQLAMRQLDGEEKIAQDELDKAAIAASSMARAQVYYKARYQRIDNWKNDFQKPRMERTIPVFRALIASDKNNEYHQNHGELGFALKDQGEPNWADAEKELSRAIAIRGDASLNGYHRYEAVRAICLIQQDQNLKQGKKSDRTLSERIRKNLTVANLSPDTAGWVKKDDVIQNWRKINVEDQ